MAICSYLVIPSEGAGAAVAERLAAMPGCDVVPADNHDVLILVTETAGPAEDRALRDTLAGLEGIRTVVLTFGQLAADGEPDVADGVILRHP